MLSKPFIKYCGGKTKLLNYILDNLPKDGFNNYFEPFVGGGSVLFGLINRDSLSNTKREYTISDINSDLIRCYEVIKYNSKQLITELNKPIYKNNSHDYYNNRKRFNKLKFKELSHQDEIEMAALFIYLNKCGYNGMYRENTLGEFNVPFGKMKQPKICDETVLFNVNSALHNNVNIAFCEYNMILNLVESCDLVYLDPPYHGTFTDYTNNKFDEEEQIKLKKFIDKLNDMGVKFMLSNSRTEFIKNLYKNYKQVDLITNYSLGGSGADRGQREEILIKNFD